MNIEEARTLDRGAKFFRGDLHIHSVTGSHDVSDAAATPENIVQTAHDEGLHFIAIVDHNEISAVELAIAAAEPSGLLMVPAVELSTAHGHLLCYFPTLEALQRFYNHLSIVDRGTANSRCSTGMVDIPRKAADNEGFGILAHIDGKKGLGTELPGAPQHKKDVICHPAMLGFELTRADSSVLYSDLDENPDRKNLARQRITSLGLGKSQFLARLLNSDSHTLVVMQRVIVKLHAIKCRTFRLKHFVSRFKMLMRVSV